MPQLDISTFASQIIWLALVFGVLYFVVARSSLPKVAQVIESREAHITAQLAAAEAAREAASTAEATREEALAKARAEAQKVISAAKDAITAETSAKLAALDVELTTRLSAAETRIREAQAQSLAQIDAVAADAAATIVEKLTGVTVGAEEAVQAVASVKA
ncbi:F0F1 ATP synthase subunit B family protein [Pedomonas mirosovicensis]|uniref:F0F1 ATP synthase subunit B family protein n=1 Tax=Pedomonas mirosovicensis TaxID=2908641 RepID=UPI002167A912|nr:ATPase [Pedomonas mirosovicensis]MCH8685658.1 ATPase [Pedomonas mirosovicensis]